MTKKYAVTVYARTVLSTVVVVEAANEKDAARLGNARVLDDVAACDWEETLSGIDSDDVDEGLTEVEEKEEEEGEVNGSSDVEK